MTLTFHKYHGTGNDFILIDNRLSKLSGISVHFISRLCHRHFGVGADGIILLNTHSTYNFEMIYYNPDGSQSLCGNGSRCAVQFAHDLGIIKDQALFLATDGVHEAFIKKGLVYLKMHQPSKVQPKLDGFFVDSGSPHYVQFVQKLEEFPLLDQAKPIRYGESFQKDGVNVNFVSKRNNHYQVRTYERGVEDETYSCGTGAVAVATVLAQKKVPSPITLETKGGELQVSFQINELEEIQDIFLIGGVVKVFEGIIAL